MSTVKYQDPITGEWLYTGAPMEKQFTESVDYPGCFYNVVNGVQEWLNPPMELGVEYKTTERYLGKPVYVIATDGGALPNKTHRVFYANAKNVEKIVGCGGEGAGYALPMLYPTTGYDIKLVANISADANIAFAVGTAMDYSAYNFTAWAKYTKTTD